MNNLVEEASGLTSDDNYLTYFQRGLSLSTLKCIKEKYVIAREEVPAECLNEELLKYINMEFYNSGEDTEAAGTVNIYISYSPEQDLCSLIDCIAGWQAHYEAKEGKKHMKFFYWVDRFCAPNRENTTLTIRKKLLQKSRMVVLVLPRWNNFEAIREASCLLEISLATQMNGTSFDVIFPPEDELKFEKACSDYNTYLTTMAEIENLANFEGAFRYLKANSQQKYLGNIQDALQIRLLVLRALRSWYIERVKDLAVKCSENKDRNAWSVLHAAGLCTRESGEYNKSVSFLSKAINELAESKSDVPAVKYLEKALSLVENKQYDEAWTLMNGLVTRSFKEMSLKCRSQLEIAYSKSLVGKGHLSQARKFLEQVDLDMDSLFTPDALALLADIDSREGKWDEAEKKFRQIRGPEAEKKFRQIRGPVERSGDFDVNMCNAKYLIELLYSEHLVRKVLDTVMTPGDHEKALMGAKENLSKLETLVSIFIDMKGERHPDSIRAAGISLELNLLANPDKLWEKYLNKDGGMIRKWCATRHRNANSITVLHWNILADALAFADLVKDGFACDNHVLTWRNNRKDKIITEILKHDPDVFGLVELDHYDDLRSILSRFGYESVWLKKNRDFYKDGGAIFWKHARFIKLDELLTPLKKNGKYTDQVLVSVRLAPLGDEKNSFAVGCVHLKSTKKAKGEAARLDQAKQVVSLYEERYGNCPRILLSDLNGESSEKVTRDYAPEAYPFIVDSGFRSAYKEVSGTEPDFTSWKFRAKDEFRYTIDFVFHTKDINSKAVLLMPSEDQFDRKLLLPSMKMPSDHLPLVTELEMPWS